ncbi:MAG: hypothetical protein ACFFDT_37470 [Candidatus Hodarchaeota archaeon]
MNETYLDRNRKELILKRVEQFKRKQKKQAYIVTTFWFLLVAGFTIVISSFFQLHEVPIRNIIISFLCGVVIVNWIYFIPFLGILLIVTIRTRSRNFFFQLFPNLGLLVIITIATLSNFIEFKEDILTFLFIGVLLMIVILECVFLRLVIQGARENKKPLFLWNFFQDSFEAYSSTIVSQQALLIHEVQNGYSQRPFFTDFTEITQYCSSVTKFKSQIREYIHFLTERSELIGWDIRDSSVTLYPRMLMGNPDLGLGIKYLWVLFFKIIKKEGLTTITINYNSQELSLRIAKQDYDLLNEVTYHLLSQLLLERFKQSIIAFLEDNRERAYSILFPLKGS